MKFLNKKEQVWDIKLTSYGHYLLSMGKFKPVYYGFYDDNVLYDGRYAFITESSNKIHDRIKNKTQYLESQTLFEEIETTQKIVDAGSVSYYPGDLSPVMLSPRKDNFKFDRMIGDAYLEGEKDAVPAWKIVTLNGNIRSSTLWDETNDVKIPQINVQSIYRKKIIPNKNYSSISATTGTVRQQIGESLAFRDGKKVELVGEDVMVYVEELNTSLLVENFDIEVFEILTASADPIRPGLSKASTFDRKFFVPSYEKVEGIIDAEYLKKMNNLSQANEKVEASHHSSSVNYYFDIMCDQYTDKEIACKNAEVFNKKSLYIDLDFHCEKYKDKDGIGFIDIYGLRTEPDICQ